MEGRSLNFNCEYKSATSSLKQIRDDLKVFFSKDNIDSDDLSNIIIAVNEACMNIIQHSSSGHYDGSITLFIECLSNEIIFEISDDSDFVDIASLVPQDNDLLKPGGHGLHIINQIMNSVTYSHKDGLNGNNLLMKKAIKRK